MRKGWSTVATLLFVSSVFCRPENDGVFQTDIAGGKPAELYPFFVSVYAYDLEYEMKVCGGTIIASNVVLTAAQCVAQRNPKQISIVKSDFTKTNRDRSGYEVFSIKNYLVHPDYVPWNYPFSHGHNDVALLYLNGSLDLEQPNYGKVPICDASEDYPKATAIGLGETSWDGTDSEVLMEVDLPLRHVCKEMYRDFYPEKQVCYGEMFKKDACPGDYGGPLVYKENGRVKCLHGIMSYGWICGGYAPGVYERAGYYKDWIMSNMSN